MPKGEKSQTVKSESNSAKSPSAKSPTTKSSESKVKKTKKVVEEAAPPVEEAEPVVEKKVKKTKKKVEEAAPVVEQVEEAAPVEKKVKKVKKVKDPNAPKKELNPIMKEMNKFRNEVIGAVLGSKAPKVTIPPFKLAMADAREKMGLSEKDKNTVETVLKAVELFNKNNKKYL